MTSVIEELNSIDFKSATSDDVRRIIGDTAMLCVPAEIKTGTYILRARRGKGYKKRSQMTYCPAKKCTELQRATLPNHTMFYGVISDDILQMQNAQLISIGECSKLCRDGKSSSGRERITISCWEVVKPIEVISFITDETFSNVTENKLLNLLRDGFRLHHGGNNSTEDEKNLVRFLSKEFAKKVDDSREYLISATIASDILQKSIIDGIVYPSVMLCGQAGLNIALSSKAVNKKLKFCYTVDNTFYKNKEKSIPRMESLHIKGKSYKISQIPDVVIETMIGVKKLSDLELINND